MPSGLTDVRVERFAGEGEAIARAPGSARVVFVPYGVPGDELAVRIVETKERFARGRIERVKVPGPERVPPPCPHHFAPADASSASPPCGGCDWQQLAYEAQLKYKRELVLDSLRHLARVTDAEVAPVVPSPSPWGYRNKVLVPFGRDGAGVVVAGFYAPGSHKIVDLRVCPVQPELSVRLVLRVKEIARREGWPIYEEKTGKGWLRHLLVRTNAEGKALAALVTRTATFPREEAFIGEMREAFPEIVALYQNLQPLKTSVVLGPEWRRLWSGGRFAEMIGPFSFVGAPNSFLQVNTPAAEKLCKAAFEALTAGDEKFDQLFDLYCGIGMFSLWAARAARRVVGIEENPQAVRDAWANAKRNGIKNARFVAGRAEEALRPLEREIGRDAAALVDPPRAGLSVQVSRFLAQSPLRRIVYVSCNPATFARDAAFFRKTGFKLGKIQPVDLFPQTSHVELVARLDR